MAGHRQPLLDKIFNKKEITSLLSEFEELVPCFNLSLCSKSGKILAGDGGFSLTKITTLLENADKEVVIGFEEDFIQPLFFGTQNKWAIIAHRINQDEETKSTLLVKQVLVCLKHTLSLLLTKSLETLDVVDETIDRYREINLLYRIGETIGTCLDPEKIPSLVLEETNRCILFEAGFVLLDPNNSFEKENRNFEIKSSIGTKGHLRVLEKISKNCIEKMREQKQPAISTKPFDGKPKKKVNDLFASILCVPLQIQERILGVIVLGRLSADNIFTAGEMKLLMALASQASIALETVRLHLEEIQKQRLDEELAISHQIQLSLLPDACPDPNGWEFAAMYQSARQVGGDLYDFIQIPSQPDHLGLLIADVAGKGIPAALFMAFCRTVIRMVAMSKHTPAYIINRGQPIDTSK